MPLTVAQLDTFRPKFSPFTDVCHTDFGGTGDGIADDATAITRAQAACGALGKVLIPPGTYRISENITITSALEIIPGAVLKPDNGVVVTIQGTVHAHDVKWIDISAGGKVGFAPSAPVKISASWWGIAGDYNFTTQTGTDNTAAFQAFAAALTTANVNQTCTCYVPPGAYYLKAGMVFTQHWTALKLTGVNLVFDPVADGSICVAFNRGPGNELFGCEVEDGQCMSPSTNTAAKIGLNLVDVSNFKIRGKFSTHNSWTSNARKDTNPSIGLLTNGRELIHTDRGVQFAADWPVQISKNPNVRIDLDTCNLDGLYLLVQNTHGDCVLIDSGCAILNSKIGGGVATWTGGRDGVRFVNVAGQAVTCTNLTIGNIRRETTSDTTGYAVNIVTDASQLTTLKLENIQPAFTQHGIKGRGVNGVRMTDIRYSGGADPTRMVVDFDNTCENVEWANVWAQAGNGFSLTNLRYGWAAGLNTDLLLPTHAILRRDSDADCAEVISDPTGAGGFRFSLKGGSRVFELRPVNQGVTNDGWTLWDLTNGKKLLFMSTDDLIHIGQGGLIVEQSAAGVASTLYAYGPDNTRYKLVPPVGGGAATWVAG